MAKTKVEQYIFQPGIPVTDNRYHMAYDLIKENTEFVCDETAAWIAEQVKLEATYPNAYAQIIANKEFVADETMAWFDATYPGAHDLNYNVSAAAFTPTTGVLILTIGTHGFAIGSTLRIATNSLTFTCAQDSHATNHTYPRASGAAAAPGGYDYAFQTPLSISAVTSTTVTINVGPNGAITNTTDHIFISATAGCIASNERHEKCERDTRYNIDAIANDLYTGGNSKCIEYARKYWVGTNSNLANSTEQTYALAVNNKVAEIFKDYILKNVAYTTQQSPIVTTQDVSNPVGESYAVYRVIDLKNILNDVTENGLSAIPAVMASWAGYTYDPALCERDTRINIQGVEGDGGMLFDLRYGGNEQTRYTASKYWINSTPQIDGDRTPERFAKQFARDLINNYILTQPTPAPTFPYALVLLDANKEFIADEVMAWFDNTYPGVHTADRHVKCERDTKFNIDAIRSDVFTGGNHQAIKMGNKYFTGIATLLGSGEQTYALAVNTKVQDIINNYILTNTTYTTQQVPVVTTQTTNANNGEAGCTSRVADSITILNNITENGPSAAPTPGYSNAGYTSLQTATTQYFNTASVAESAAAGIITNRFGIIIDVVENGLDNVPALERAGVSAIRLQTRVPTNDLLLITNTTVNQVLYNFSDPDKGATVKFQTDMNALTKNVDDDFPKFLERTGTVTTIFLDANTDNPTYHPNAIMQLENNSTFLQKEATAWIGNNVSTTTTYPYANALIVANKEWLADEVMAWFDITYPGVHDTVQHEKCERDTKYNIDAIAYDILNGSNSKTIEYAKRYWEGVTSNLTNSGEGGFTATTAQEISYAIAVNNKLRDLIITNVLTNTIWTTVQSPIVTVQSTTANNGEAKTLGRVTDLVAIFTSVIQSGTSVLPNTIPSWNDYTYNGPKCERDVKYQLDALKYDLKYGGNLETYKTSEKYWNGATPQIDGDRSHEVYTKEFVLRLINHYVFKNILWPTLQSGTGTVAQSTIYTAAELGTSDRTSELFKVVNDVITYGTSVLPVKDERLIFSESDDLQIFIDQGELRVRPYDFGTDAIERMRVSNSVSMLDADFEYGLQPTKWQAIATQRGYPSIYEVPGTDKQVQKVQTDASAGTGGIGQSLITITTIGAHNLEPGTPITLKALENSVAGASRAEGSFIISTVPTISTFTYFAKSKVGTASGEVLSTFYTQLREAGFYTGAAIGNPTFTIESQGSAGVLYNPLAALNGADKIAWDGTSPEVGSPMLVELGMAIAIYTYSAADASRTAGTYNNILGTTDSIAADVIAPTVNLVIDGAGAAVATIVTGGRRNAVNDTITVADNLLGSGGAAVLTFKIQTISNGAGIPTGAQVTSVQGTGGPIATLQTSSDVAIGSNVIPVTNTSGVLTGMGINRGDGTAVYISSVVGNDINLDGNTTNAIVGNNVTYTGVSGTNYTSSGFGGTFDISRSGGVYTVTVNGDGDDYEDDDVVMVLGNALGGTTPEHDCKIVITDADTSGDIVTITSTGTAFDGNANYAGLTGTNSNGQGLGALFNITYTNNAYSVSLAQPTYTNATGTFTGGVGLSASFDVTLTNNAYTIALNAADASTGYILNDYIKIDGLALGGVSSTNDALVKVTGVNAGAITSMILTGVGADANVTYADVTYTTASIGGTTAAININRVGAVYTVAIPGGGSGYAVNDTLNILGTALGGTSPANDAIVTIATIDLGGAGTALTGTITGTAVNTQTFADITSHTNQIGTNAQFDVTVDYTNTYSAIIGPVGGETYNVDSQIVILGTAIGGATPANDATVTVTSVNAVGLITGFTIAGTSADATIQYVVGDLLKIAGPQLGGLNTTNDAEVTVSSVSGTGKITGLTISGTAADATAVYSSPAYTTNTVSGATADFTVTRTDIAYSAIISTAGTGYLTGETFTIDGANLGGGSSTNDCTITIASVGGGGEVATITVAGTALDQASYNGISQADGQAVMVTGAGATWNVVLSGGTYTPTIANGGTLYNASQTIKILGAQVGGTSPTNDLSVTILTVSVSGGIATFSHTGTAPGGTGSYTDVGGTNLNNVGINATFTISRSTGVYSTPTIVVDGQNYLAGNKIKIVGSTLGGVDGVNDIIILVGAVTTDGSISSATGLGTGLTGTVVQTYSSVTISEPITQALTAQSTIAFAALATVEVTFSTAHGLVPGDSFIITVSSDSGANNHTLCEGPFFAQQIPTIFKLKYQCRAPGTIGDINDIVASIYPRPDSFFVHRPYDGGVMLGTGGPQHGAQAIRQSKKYIRYQSGKGIMYTTGALFAPSYDLLAVTADAVAIGSFITVTTDDVDHGLQIGGRVRLIGIETPGYNGDYTVASIVSERQFRVVADFKLGNLAPTLSARAQVSLLTWHGATVRSGAFDDQNGIFMEYDGENFTCVQRTATLQLAGTVSVAVDSNLCTGVGTRFRDQLKAGDRIVIKGMTHVVSNITNDLNMYLTPDFRGVTPASACKICLVSDKKTKQNEFNKDRIDGTGSSGYNIDISKMQMMGIQYSWYGAGFIDYMLRGDDGNFIFFHRMRNSNINTEAFMRTGNMPVRYEITNEGPNGKLAADIDYAQTTIPLVDAKYFPTSGTIMIDGEMINYTGITGDTLIGATRSAPMSNYASGANRTYTAGLAEAHTAKTGVPLISNTISPIISHWGSAFLTDGGFDTDRGYIFSYASTGNTITTTRNTVFMLRLAPSVSNAIVGDLGERELLNRAQLLLEGIEVTSDTSTGGIVIEGVLNPQNYPLDPGNVGWSGLSGLAAGGQPSFAQVAPGGSVTWSTGATQVVRNATTTAQMTESANSLYSRNSTQWHYFSTSEWEAISDAVVTGTEIVATGNPASGPSDFPSGTVVSSIYEQSYYGRYQVLTSNRNSGYISSGESVTFAVGGALTNTNYLYFTKVSWESTNAVSGTEVSDAKFPAGTAVSNVQGPLTFGGVEYYKITFSQTSLALVSAGATVGFLFGQPPYAQPGETVFSFIANPGSLANLDLTGLKELTNTTLGGRGTYPNGPDVLAINVYKTSGAAVDANIILRWGEAQA